MVRGAVVWVLDTCVVVLYVMRGRGCFRVRICKSPRCCVACRLPVRTRKQEIGEKREREMERKKAAGSDSYP